MFDPKETVKAARAVTLRELVRTAGSLIDEIEMHGNVFALSKYGRMVALVEFIGPGLDDDVKVHEGPMDARPEWLELDHLQRRILQTAWGNHPMPWQTALLYGDESEPAPDPSTLGRGLVGIELRRLMERIGSGWNLTRDGVAAARWLDT